MTKKALVELLDENFKDDDEVFIKYDDQGTLVSSVKAIEDVTQNFIKHHFEVLDNYNNWVKWESNYHPSKWYSENMWCKIIDREWSETKKCIVVKR